ncbi:MAG: ComEA family DNA-binding protein, partial [bacterium]
SAFSVAAAIARSLSLRRSRIDSLRTEPTCPFSHLAATARERAAKWLKGQVGSVRRESIRDLRSESDRAIAAATEKAELRADARLASESERLEVEAKNRIEAARDDALREARAEAEALAAQRIQELAAELEEAASSLRAADQKLQEVTARAVAAEERAVELGDKKKRTRKAERDEAFELAAKRAEDLAVKASAAQAYATVAEIRSSAKPKGEFVPPEPKAKKTAAKKPAAKKPAAKKPAAKKPAAKKPAAKKPAAKKPASKKSRSSGKTGAASKSRKKVDLDAATFEDFREMGMTVTQATRVIAYRERGARFDSVDDLAEVPGISKTLLDELRKSRS